MFQQIWAALFYLYGILLNSIYQCPEYSQLTTQGLDGKEVWLENGGKGRQGMYGLLRTWWVSRKGGTGYGINSFDEKV